MYYDSTIALSLSPVQKARLVEIAKARGVNRSAFVRRLIDLVYEGWKKEEASAATMASGGEEGMVYGVDFGLDLENYFLDVGAAALCAAIFGLQRWEEWQAGPDLTKAVEDILETLDPREARVLRLKYGMGSVPLSWHEIGEKFNVTRERIRQIQNQALRKLRHPMRSRRLREFERQREEVSNRSKTGAT